MLAYLASLTYVYTDTSSYDPLALIDGTDSPEIFWFHNQPNGLPERMTEVEGNLRWEGQSSAWGKLLRETTCKVRIIRKISACRASIWTETNLSGTNLNNALALAPKG